MMGITFFDDEQLAYFFKKHSRGIELLSEKEERRDRNREKGRSSGIQFLMRRDINETEKGRPSLYAASYSASYSPPILDEYEEQRLLEHVETNFKVGFAEQNEHATTASNLMEFANENRANAYRYYLWFLEKDENQWMDAELFESALQPQTKNLKLHPLKCNPKHSSLNSGSLLLQVNCSVHHGSCPTRITYPSPPPLFRTSYH